MFAADGSTMCRVRLTESDSNPDTVSLQWANKTYRLIKGKEGFIPSEAILTHFGDPRASDSIVGVKEGEHTVGWIPDRRSEVSRIRLLWGAEDPQRPNFDDMFQDGKIPLIEVYDLEGDRILTVLDDPVGDNLLAATQTKAEKSDLAELIRRQQEQIDRLKMELGLEDITSEEQLPSDEGSDKPLFTGVT